METRSSVTGPKVTRKNTKIKTTPSVDKGRILIWIVVTNNNFWEEVMLNTTYELELAGGRILLIRF